MFWIPLELSRRMIQYGCWKNQDMLGWQILGTVFWEIQGYPCFFTRSNHVFTMWQHLILLTIRQYEGKSYRMFVEWLIEAHYLRLFLGLSRIPHFTTLQKFTDRINSSLRERIISSFIVITGTKHIFVGIDSTGFKITHALQYYTERTGFRRKYAKLSIGADILQ